MSNQNSIAEGQDSLISARKIRQEITKKDDISNAFDGITYQKGAAVIGMFETIIGPAEFRKGVQSYLKQYAFKNSTAPEFLDSISSASKKERHQGIFDVLESGWRTGSIRFARLRSANARPASGAAEIFAIGYQE